VYRCFTLTVPTLPASDERLCLKDQAGYYSFQSTAAHFDDFLSPGRKLWCDMTCTVLAGAGANEGFVISAARRCP
jgi:hypothetical protein